MLSLHPQSLELLPAGASILLGLSGGRDSVALLLLLQERGCRVIARHLHHNIRGAAADADAQFCQELCAKRGVEYASEQQDIPSIAAAAGESLELCARRVRRQYLLDEARRSGCALIGLAQHADDQAETVLFRMARGAAGPRAMRVVQAYEGLNIVRPLLAQRRASITQYLQERGQEWRDDQSNESTAHSRNAIRHKVIPAYAQAMGRDIVPILNRSAELQGELNEALDAALRQMKPQFYDPQGRLYLPALRASEAALARAVVMNYLKEQGVRQLSRKLIVEVEGLMGMSGKRARVNLAGGRQLRRAHQRLFVEEV